LETRSPWLIGYERHATTRLVSDEPYDIAIVGAGIAGISAAYHLRSFGAKVILIEGRTVLSGVTGHTTGKLTAQHQLVYHSLTKEHGADFAGMYAAANLWAIDFVRNFGCECDFRDEPACVFASEPDDVEALEREFEACVDADLPVRLLTSDEVPVPSFGGLRMEGQASFHPVKFLDRLLRKALTNGVRLTESCRATAVEEAKSFCLVRTNQGVIRADHVVIATHYPIEDSGWFVAKLAPYRSYATAFRLKDDPPVGVYISSSEPMRSFRRMREGKEDLLIVGSGHHRVGQEADPNMNFRDIEYWARSNFNVEDVVHRWSTQDNWTPDGLPFIGVSPHRKRTFVATGFGGWGMTTGLIAGKVIAELIRDGESPWARLYDPNRSTLLHLSTGIKENLQSAKHLIGDRIKSADVGSADEVMAGMGAIVQLEHARIALSRDASGEPCALSPVCPHMGCQVAWNEAESTWDCPCHGSRFARDGAVLHGPAVEPLAPVDLVSGKALGE